LTVKPVVLKLGGSVITAKDKPFTANKRAIARLSAEIKQAEVDSLVVVHGGGSFGHPVAKEYNINKGYRGKSQIIGFSETHQAMTALNRMVLSSLINHGIPAMEVQPSSCVVTKSGRIEVMETRPLTKLLQLGLVPVLYGDVVVDSERGFAILSGDQLVSVLAIKLDADRIVIGVDVDGLYTADPKTSLSAYLIEQMTLQELKRLQNKLEKAYVTDVTGGMFGKVVELASAVEQGVEATIVNAAKPNNIYKALKGEAVVGTIVERG
jgi:isopentenyl phosphate kinase